MLAEQVKKSNKFDIRRILITLAGILLMGITLSVLRVVNLGMDSFSYMNVNIAKKIGWSLGNWQLLMNLLMFVPVIIWGRKQIGIGTLLNMVLIGYTVDFGTWLWKVTGVDRLLGEPVVRYAAMLIAVLLFILAAATYMAAETGTAPFDALPLMIWEKLGKVPFKVVRFLWDLTAVVIGFVLCGHVGIVTILMVLLLGTAVELVRDHVFGGRIEKGKENE